MSKSLSAFCGGSTPDPRMHLFWSDGENSKSKWIENVNLIVVRKATSSPQTSPFDYEVVTIERADLPFVMNKVEQLTPGIRRHLPCANLHEADFAVEWRMIIGHKLAEKYESSGSDIDLFSEQSIVLNRARQSKSGAKLLKPRLALRICALRCLFQELGVLLASTTLGVPASSDDNLLQWHRSVSKDPFEFLKLFQCESHLRPQVESLFEWWNWLTPTSIGARPRYDTLFYLVALDTSPSCTVTIERTDCFIRWSYLDKLFDSYNSKSFLMSPAQLYELARLSSHPWVQWLVQFAEEREQHGIQRWIPSNALYRDGTISFLPGDQFYPSEVDLLPKRSPRLYDTLTVEQMRQRTTSGRLNRFEHSAYWCLIVIAEDVDGGACGHSAILYNQLPVIRVAKNVTTGGLTAKL